MLSDSCYSAICSRNETYLRPLSTRLFTPLTGPGRTPVAQNGVKPG